MHQEERLNYVRTHAQPEDLDIELARQIILDHLHAASQSTSELIRSNQLLSVVTTYICSLCSAYSRLNVQGRTNKESDLYGSISRLYSVVEEHLHNAFTLLIICF